MELLRQAKGLIWPGPDRAFGLKRSSGWTPLQKRFLEENPRCPSCGRTERKWLRVHHKVPFHVRPDLELEWSNLMTLCEWPTLNCHLWIGHGGRWDHYLPDPEAAAREMYRRLAARITPPPPPQVARSSAATSWWGRWVWWFMSCVSRPASWLRSRWRGD
jgi:5-methylcytosine-specific restriction protein A